MKLFQKNMSVFLFAILTTLLWGAAFPLIKLSYRELGISADDIGTMIAFAGERFFLAGVLVLIIGKWLKNPFQLSFRNISSLFRLGIFQTFLSYVLFYIGLAYTTGVQGSIIVGSTCIFQMLLAAQMYHEPMTRNKMIGVLLGMAGIVVIHFQGLSEGFHIGIGEIAMFASVLISAYGNTYSKKVVLALSPAIVSGTQMTLGGLLLLVTGWILDGRFFVGWTVLALFDFMLLVLISSISLWIWTTLLKYHSVGKVSVFMFLIPVFGVFLSAFFVGEQIRLEHYGGLLLVIFGIVSVFIKDVLNEQKQNSL
ncbi:MAG TPA: DMT family transporter [Firmicutes bacterium]|nr:DMT family transporter [Bacillota bacterium]